MSLVVLSLNHVSLWPHGLQHARLPCPSLSPRVGSNPWVSNAIQSSCLLSSPIPPAFYLSQHQGLFQWSTLYIKWAKYWASTSASVLAMNIQGWFPLGLTGLISLQSKGLSRVFSNTTVQKHKFFCPQPSLWSNSHMHIWLLEKPQLWLDGPLLAK